MTPKLEQFAIECGLACDGTSFDDAAIVEFAQQVTKELLVELEWLISIRVPASEYVEILNRKSKEWLQ